MIWAAVLAGIAASAVTLWHMQRPRPPRIAISFSRFVPPLPAATSGKTRLALTVPRDLPTLFCLVLAALCAIWALLDADRLYRAQQPDHLGLRIVFDRSGSMAVADGPVSRFDSAMARLDLARQMVDGAGADGTCLEAVGVAGQIGPILAIGAGTPFPEADLAPMREGAEPALLLEAAALPAGDCALTHVLVLTDQPAVAGGLTERILLWDQVGAPVANAGIRSLSLLSGAFGQGAAELRVVGIASGGDVPAGLLLDGPAGALRLTVHGDPDVEGRWYAKGPYSGPGSYQARLTDGGGYDGDDLVVARIDRPAQIAVDWRLAGLSRPTVLTAGAEAAPLVTTADLLRPQDLSRPLLIAYPGFDGAAPRSGRQIGRFIEDDILFGALNFDAFEAALPTPWTGPLPPGFAPVMTDGSNAVLVARRERPFGLILPAPRLDLPETARNLSLTLFFAGLADLLALPPASQSLSWKDRSGADVVEAWRESRTDRALGTPADLAALTTTGTAQADLPIWPWAIAAALALVLAERLLRVARRHERLA